MSVLMSVARVTTEGHSNILSLCCSLKLIDVHGARCPCRYLPGAMLMSLAYAHQEELFDSVHGPC